jgi:hypothetical protein
VTDPIGGAHVHAGALGLGGHQSGQARQAVLDAAAQTLGMSKHAIRTALRGGESLADLAEEQGVSETDLTNSLATALQPFANGTDPTQLASQIVSHTGPLGHGHHGERVPKGDGGDADPGPQQPLPLPDGSGSLIDAHA